MKFNINDTTYLNDELNDCKNDEELREFLKDNEKNCINWKKYINNLVDISGMSYEKFANKCGFSKNTIKKWCLNGMKPQNRKAFIKLGFGLKMNVLEINTLLSKYGQYSELYPKDIYDAICIFVINKRENNWDDERYQYSSLEKWIKKYENMVSNYKLSKNRQKDILDTKAFYLKLEDINEDEEFEKFMYENKDVFFSSFLKLSNYINDFIKARIRNKSYEVDEKYSFHKIMKESNLGIKYEKMISNLNTKGIVPPREALIVIGISLNMTLKDINTMLKLAYMKELYVKNKVECIIIYALNDICRKNPYIELDNAIILEEITSDVELKKEYTKFIDSFIETIDDECYEDQKDELLEYIRKVLENFKVKL